MKTDTYTKGVLTVIAICLVILALRQLDLGFTVSNANAQEFGLRHPVDVNILSIDGQTFSPGQVRIGKVALPVKIIGD
jgi:hypothetical protein